jgi:hypothetical protein
VLTSEGLEKARSVLTSEGVSLSVLTSGARLQAGRSVLKCQTVCEGV